MTYGPMPPEGTGTVAAPGSSGLPYAPPQPAMSQMPHAQADPARLAAAEAECRDRQKSQGVLFAFWFFLGGFGAHRFYLGDKGIGVAQLLTLGGLGFWALIDIFFIWERLRTVNRITRSGVYSRYGLVPPQPIA